jgi:hypothetical protein
MFLSSGPRLPVKIGSGAATCPMAPGSASPRGVLRRYHVSSAPDLASLSRWAPTLPRGPSLASPSRELWCCYVPTAPSGLWTTGIKKGLAVPDMHLGSLMPKARSRVTEVPVRCADMRLQFGSTVQHRVRRQDDSMLLTPCKT